MSSAFPVFASSGSSANWLYSNPLNFIDAAWVSGGEWRSAQWIQHRMGWGPRRFDRLLAFCRENGLEVETEDRWPDYYDRQDKRFNRVRHYRFPESTVRFLHGHLDWVALMQDHESATQKGKQAAYEHSKKFVQRRRGERHRSAESAIRRIRSSAAPAYVCRGDLGGQCREQPPAVALHSVASGQSY